MPRVITRHGRINDAGTSSVRPVTQRHMHCWRKAACDGAELPLLRRTAGVCEACAKSLRTNTAIQVSVIVASGPIDRRFATRKEAGTRGAKASQASRAQVYRTPDSELARTSGWLTRVSDTVMVPKTRYGVATPVACVEVKCRCGAQWFVDRTQWTRTHNRIASCKACTSTRYAETRVQAGLPVYAVRFSHKRKKGVAA
jgi:hypothetical protein